MMENAIKLEALAAQQESIERQVTQLMQDPELQLALRTTTRTRTNPMAKNSPRQIVLQLMESGIEAKIADVLPRMRSLGYLGSDGYARFVFANLVKEGLLESPMWGVYRKPIPPTLEELHGPLAALRRA